VIRPVSGHLLRLRAASESLIGSAWHSRIGRSRQPDSRAAARWGAETRLLGRRGPRCVIAGNRAQGRADIPHLGRRGQLQQRLDERAALVRRRGVNADAAPDVIVVPAAADTPLDKRYRACEDVRDWPHPGMTARARSPFASSRDRENPGRQWLARSEGRLSPISLPPLLLSSTYDGRKTSPSELGPRVHVQAGILPDGPKCPRAACATES
jgi:hypothetical protein